MRGRWQTLLTLIRVVGEKTGSDTASSLIKLIQFCRSLLTLLRLKTGLFEISHGLYEFHWQVGWTINGRSRNKGLERDPQSSSSTKDHNLPLKGCSKCSSAGSNREGWCSFCYMCLTDLVCPQ
ncbi:hypothetical protein M9H77_32224 [Catharanthus roseus]|uniref:Uncharacterized protein n=1 Tax=Catharanthus roseus TaxID=4058 RepID=A0ACC0A508_CATRO|nr:hypothetical protein M9H77_32224 [Catharanthus roseus]